MAFDGIVIAALADELRRKLVGGRVMKVSQPERDELILTIKNYDQFRLLLSADASLPLIYLTETNKEAPLQSPAFCMLLRKHLQSAKITAISQPGLERIINIDFEHLDDMGDIKNKRLIIEIMGKHSNIIFCDDNGIVLDSIKRVPATVSSVREVLPGRNYFIPQTVEKADPFTVTEEAFVSRLRSSGQELSKAIYSQITGISPIVAGEILFRAGLVQDLSRDVSERNAEGLEPDLMTHLYRVFRRLTEDVSNGNFEPCIVYKNSEPFEFGAVRLTCLEIEQGSEVRTYESVSAMLADYYEARSTITRIRQRASDLTRIITNALARASKKYDLQLRQLQDTEKRDKFRIYGELLTTYGYGIEPGADKASLENYYTGELITVPLDPSLSAIENAKSYFDKYSKLKRTFEALSGFIVETREEIEHLESIRLALDIARHEEDLSAIRDELVEFGYMKRRASDSQNGNRGSNKPGKKGGRRISAPFHYLTSDGFHIYVGKNNYQNDELTFKFAVGQDWWFHVKQDAGSHVILKTDGREIPDRVFEQAAALAAYYSKKRESDKVEVDYLERKNVKKPAGAKPGFVVYYTNYSMIAVPQIEGLQAIE